MRHDERWPVVILDHVSNAECLTGAGGAEERLETVPAHESLGQLLDGAGLVTLGFVLGGQAEVRHVSRKTARGGLISGQIRLVERFPALHLQQPFHPSHRPYDLLQVGQVLHLHSELSLHATFDG